MPPAGGVAWTGDMECTMHFVQFLGSLIRNRHFADFLQYLHGAPGLIIDKSTVSLWLPIACANGQSSVVSLLLARGAEVDHFPIYRWECTPLIAAVKCNSLDTVRLLLTAGATVNLAPVINGGQTPLWIAASKGSTAIGQCLVDAGADLHYPCVHTGYSPLLQAVRNGHDGMVQMLLAAGADVRPQANGANLLEHANNTYTTSVLLIAGAGLHAPPESWLTPIVAYPKLGCVCKTTPCVCKLDLLPTILASPLATMAARTNGFHAEGRRALALGRFDPDDTWVTATSMLKYATCNDTIRFVKDALLPWAPVRHMLYHAKFKKAVRTLMLVHRSLQKGGEIPVLPREMWWHVLALCNRSAWPVRRR